MYVKITHSSGTDKNDNEKGKEQNKSKSMENSMIREINFCYYHLFMFDKYDL